MKKGTREEGRSAAGPLGLSLQFAQWSWLLHLPTLTLALPSCTWNEMTEQRLHIVTRKETSGTGTVDPQTNVRCNRSEFKRWVPEQKQVQYS
jgi:hypothetical protein